VDVAAYPDRRVQDGSTALWAEGSVILTGLSACLLIIAADDAPVTSTGLKVGADLPGPFHPYNVTGPYKSRFHCPVSESALGPGVLVFVRDAMASAPLPKLLKALDDRMDKNATLRMHGAVVFIPPETLLPDVLKDDDQREKLAAKLLDEATAANLKYIVFDLDSGADLQRYKLGDETWCTVVLFDKYKVAAVHELPRDEAAADKKIDEILADVAGKLKATKTKRGVI
jgi:hypothetical protein